MSSVTEGLGSAVLDAMAMRLAVVGTHAGGIPEAVVPGETGGTGGAGGPETAGGGDREAVEERRAGDEAYGEAGCAGSGICSGLIGWSTVHSLHTSVSQETKRKPTGG